LFRNPKALRSYLVEGLSQSSVDCMVPEVLVRRKLYKFLDTELDNLYMPDKTIKLFAHPNKNQEDIRKSILSLGI
jgi:hypothetical protein